MQNSFANEGTADCRKTGTDGQSAGPQEGMTHLKSSFVKATLKSIPSAGN